MNAVLLWTSVAVAGAAGAVCRYLVDFVVTVRRAAPFPWGTLVVNVSGSFLFGLVAGLTGGRLPDEARLVLAVGFCGAYTTFSTHMVDTAHLVQEGRAGQAVANVLGSIAVGVAAVTAGLLMAGMWS